MRHQPALVGYYAAFGILLVVGALINPKYNWDIIGYIAGAKSFAIHDTSGLHGSVYDALERSIPEAYY